MRRTVPSKKEKEKWKMVTEGEYDQCILYTCVKSLIMKCIILYIYMLNLKLPKDGDVGLCKAKKNSLNL